jgi:hypothetical protein
MLANEMRYYSTVSKIKSVMEQYNCYINYQ